MSGDDELVLNFESKESVSSTFSSRKRWSISHAKGKKRLKSKESAEFQGAREKALSTVTESRATDDGPKLAEFQQTAINLSEKKPQNENHAPTRIFLNKKPLQFRKRKSGQLQTDAVEQKQEKKNVSFLKSLNGSSGETVTDTKIIDVFAVESFTELGLADSLATHLQDQLMYKSPTVIQKAAIPAILSGKDVLVKADTGTGKTLVYLAPIFHMLASADAKISRSQGTLALILAPTRELCLQIHDLALKLARRFPYIVPGHVMGGENRGKEKARLRKGVSLLVATPGRLLDHLQNTSSFQLNSLKFLVFDEADRLLDLGFEKDILAIIEFLQTAADKSSSSRVQTLLLSATLSKRVASLASLSLKKPITVSVDDGRAAGDPASNSVAAEDDSWVPADANESFSVPSQLSQTFVKVPCRLRLVALLGLLKSSLSTVAPKILVFFSTCHSVDFHHALLSASPGRSSLRPGAPELVPLACPVWRLHGKMEQKDRVQSMAQFLGSPEGVLLCTDVAARGLDIPGVSLIVQYDPAGEVSSYVHRVGRTARLGKGGEAVLFVLPSEMEYLAELSSHGVDIREISPLSILAGSQGFKAKGGGRIAPSAQESVLLENHKGASQALAAMESIVANNAHLQELATDAFRSFVRAYAAHRGSLKMVFHPRKLHLGHVAKSFGLKDAPSLLGMSSVAKAIAKEGRNRKLEMKKQQKRKAGRLMPASMAS